MRICSLFHLKIRYGKFFLESLKKWMIHKLKLGPPFVAVHTERMLLEYPLCTACLLGDAKSPPSPPMNVRRRVGQRERLFNFHRLGQSVVGHGDTVISCYSRSTRALVTGTLFQVPSGFCVFLQIKLGKGHGGGLCSEFWMSIFTNWSWRGTRIPRTLKDLL